MTEELENIQRLYYRCRLDCNHDYLERINNLQLESLELRRIYNDMTMVFKIVHTFIFKDAEPIQWWRLPSFGLVFSSYKL